MPTDGALIPLEVLLQARINRSQSLQGIRNPSAISLAGGEREPSVEVELSDGTKVFREIMFNEEGRPTADQKSYKSFAVVPFVLRRADILKFWNTPDAQRQFVFKDYFRTSSHEEWHDSPSEEKLELERERLEAKQKRRAIGARIARRMKVDTDQVPLRACANRRVGYVSIVVRRQFGYQKAARVRPALPYWRGLLIYY